MAISTYKTYLMKKSGTSYSKLVDIKDFPDLGAAPETIDVTSLSDPARVYIPGIQSTEQMEFTANYTLANFTTLKALEGTETDFSVWFGATTTNNVDTPSGSDGKFDFKGYLSVYVAGGAVNEAVDMKIAISPTTAITQSQSA